MKLFKIIMSELGQVVNHPAHLCCSKHCPGFRPQCIDILLGHFNALTIGMLNIEVNLVQVESPIITLSIIILSINEIACLFNDHQFALNSQPVELGRNKKFDLMSNLPS